MALVKQEEYLGGSKLRHAEHEVVLARRACALIQRQVDAPDISPFSFRRAKHNAGDERCNASIYCSLPGCFVLHAVGRLPDRSIDSRYRPVQDRLRRQSVVAAHLLILGRAGKVLVARDSWLSAVIDRVIGRRYGVDGI